MNLIEKYTVIPNKWFNRARNNISNVDSLSIKSFQDGKLFILRMLNGQNAQLKKGNWRDHAPGGTLTEDRVQEHTLIEHLKAGDHGAIDEIVEMYKGPLFAFIVRMVNDNTTAEDIFQETWIKVIKHAGKFRGDA